MTPTEQDNELREAVWASLAKQITQAITCTDPAQTKQNRTEYLHTNTFEKLMKHITADRNRVALPAIHQRHRMVDLPED